jgi:AraC family transcriptional regulator
MVARQVLASGQVYVWPGGTLWIGEARGGTDLHAHHALQVTLAWTGEVQFRGKAGSWLRVRACTIPSDLPHAFRGDHVTAAHIFIEPESTIGRGILSRWSGAPGIRVLDIGDCEPASSALYEAWQGPHHPSRLVPAAQQVLATLGGRDTPATTDPRVLGAIEVIRARIDGPVTLTEVAREIYISPSRLRHLFVQETGLPFRRYVLWQRLQQVFALMTTASLTEAAHAAGFADAAHMSRTFRRMLGIAPTNLEADSTE